MAEIANDFLSVDNGGDGLKVAVTMGTAGDVDLKNVGEHFGPLMIFEGCVGTCVMVITKLKALFYLWLKGDFASYR